MANYTRHFWPGPATFTRTPGARLPCRIRPPSGTAFGTPDPAAVTCKRCRAALQRREILDYAPRDGGPWPRDLLEAAGLLAPGSPDPAPPRPPPEMRRPIPHPLEIMGDRWRHRAAVEFSRRNVDPAAASVARALISCAAEVGDFLRHARGVR